MAPLSETIDVTFGLLGHRTSAVLRVTLQISAVGTITRLFFLEAGLLLPCPCLSYTLPILTILNTLYALFLFFFFYGNNTFLPAVMNDCFRTLRESLAKVLAKVCLI